MGVTEGRGVVAPGAILVTFDDAELDLIRRMGQRWADGRRYHERKDAWGKGFVPEAWFIGEVGEAAFVKWVNRNMGDGTCQIDKQFSEYGDGGIDTIAFGVSVQVKTVTSPPEAMKPMLIRRVNDRRDLLPLNADVFVLASAADVHKPKLLGWVKRKELQRFSKSKVFAETYNIEVPRAELKPMTRLLALMEARKRGASCP